MNPSTLIGMLVGVITIVGSIVGAAVWIVQKSAKAVDDRINERITENLKPLLAMMMTLNGEPGDEERGIPARPGILQRETVTARRVADIYQEVGTVKHELSGVRGLVDTILSALTTNNGGSTVLDKLELLQRTAENNRPRTA